MKPRGRSVLQAGIAMTSPLLHEEELLRMLACGQTEAVEFKIKLRRPCGLAEPTRET